MAFNTFNSCRLNPGLKIILQFASGCVNLDDSSPFGLNIYLKIKLYITEGDAIGHLSKVNETQTGDRKSQKEVSDLFRHLKCLSYKTSPSKTSPHLLNHRKFIAKYKSLKINLTRVFWFRTFCHLCPSLTLECPNLYSKTSWYFEQSKMKILGKLPLCRLVLVSARHGGKTMCERKNCIFDWYVSQMISQG